MTRGEDNGTAVAVRALWEHRTGVVYEVEPPPGRLYDEMFEAMDDVINALVADGWTAPE